MIFLRLIPDSQPITGIIAWKKPKNSAIFRACLILRYLIVIPLVIDTAKASIAKPVEMSKIEKMFTLRNIIRIMEIARLSD